MQTPLGIKTRHSADPSTKPANIFVLSTGRCGSVTFARACSHMTNYTSGHETRCRELGEDRFTYPAGHIEADNRLSWFLGCLDARFGDEAVYVHLRRDADLVAESYNRRWTFHGSILMAFGRGVLKSRSGELNIARDYVRTVTENITHFLANKSRVHHVDIDDPLYAFETFWRDIGAEGDLEKALSEFTKKHNASAHSSSDASGSDANWADIVAKQLETSENRLQIKIQKLKNAKAKVEKEKALLEHELETMTVSRLVRNRVKLAIHNTKSTLRNQPKQSLSKFLPKRQRKRLKTSQKQNAEIRLKRSRLDQDGRYRSPLDLRMQWDRASCFKPYEAMLWSFYEEHAVVRFERLAHEQQTVGDLVQSHWALARWHWSKGRFEKALFLLEKLRAALPKAQWPLEFRSFEARTLSQLGRSSEALERASEDSAEMLLTRFSILRQANQDTEACLEPLNALYLKQDLAPIELRDRTRPLSISNLMAKAEPDPRSHEAQVSVVMPAFEAEETIGFAIEGILRQSWANLELIVVDDASQDRTWEIVCALAKSDPRIIPIRQPENRGAYAARNTGLHAANGRFITINDADDWSHPEKLALQAKAKLDDGLVNGTCGARAYWDLQLNRASNYRSPSTLNLSSLLFERSIALELNGWDLMRFGADSEFRHRYKRHVGSAHQLLAPDTPMAWILTSEGSLTRSKVAGLQSLHYGARQQCREAYRDWHERATSLRLGETRDFPVPRIALTKASDPIVCDELLISDFSRIDSAEVELQSIMQALAKQRRIALFHLPRLERFNQPFNKSVRGLIRQHTLPVVVPGESIKSEFVTILDCSGLEFLPVARPSVMTDAAYISAANLALLSSKLGDEGAKARIAEVVGKEPEIIKGADFMVETPPMETGDQKRERKPIVTTVQVR